MSDKKYVLITGATSGIGFELTKLFAQDKYNLILVARSQEELNKTASKFKNSGVEIITIAKDLFQKESPKYIYQEVKNKGMEVDVLVNNAGQGEFGKFIDNDLERELDIVQLNINATIVLTKLFLREMVARGSGRILNLSSIAGKIPGPYQAVYHGTKSFIHSFTEAVRNEVKDSGVTLTSLLPGPTDTDFFHKADMESSKIIRDQELSDPAKVAKDGYEALMEGEDMVVSGMKNKMQATMSRFMPDRKSADTMRNQQKPVQKEKKHPKE